MTLKQLAEASNITTGSARARLMNVGRSLKAIAGRERKARQRLDQQIRKRSEGSRLERQALGLDTCLPLPEPKPPPG